MLKSRNASLGKARGKATRGIYYLSYIFSTLCSSSMIFFTSVLSLLSKPNHASARSKWNEVGSSSSSGTYRKKNIWSVFSSFNF